MRTLQLPRGTRKTSTEESVTHHCVGPAPQIDEVVPPAIVLGGVIHHLLDNIGDPRLLRNHSSERIIVTVANH